jgi:SAM-dependent methyltransferase
MLLCPSCGHRYPIKRSVPRFVSGENYAKGFGLQWTLHARTQFDSQSGSRISETRFFEETKWPRDLEGELILEIGSGAGRFTEQAASTGATVVSLEFSNAVDANFASNGHLDNVLIVQGDVYEMPVRDEQFERILCFGVLQHTPNVMGAFRALRRPLKVGGSLVVDVYEKPKGFRRLSATRYFVRAVTRRIPPALLYRMVRSYVTISWPLARLLTRIPKLGKKINWLLLIADYQGVYDLPAKTLREWAILDTFDMLAPRYDSPQSLEDVRAWFQSGGFCQVEVQRGYNGIEGRGIKGAS